MKRFTEAYTRARDVIEKQEFEADWETYLTKKCNVGTLFGEKGFVKASARAPDLVRSRIIEKACGGSTVGDVIYAAAQGGTPAISAKDRAATLKMIRHVYRIAEKGSQDVWVYSPPSGDVGWVFDEIAGDAKTIKAKLAREEEIFTAEQMKWMSSALHVARKISEDARAKLSAFLGASQKTKDTVRHWFLDEDCGEAELKAAMSKLNAGFKKIATACSASTLVFADYPDWRAQRDNYFGAAIRGGEGGGFPVVYLEGAFTRLTGNTGKTWLCAETIIHELSHLEVSTHDHRYDDAGLKPDKSLFPYAKAIDNADSWGYFALDLAGYLSKADHNNTWK
jgi:hypothetical protein